MKWYDIPLALATGGASVLPTLAFRYGIPSAAKAVSSGMVNTLSGANSLANSAVTTQQTYNSQEAQAQRDWEERMSNTAVQRQVQDIKDAGLNPWLALNGGSVNGASTPSGASASSNSAFAEVYGMTNVFGSMLKAFTSTLNSAMSVVGNVAKAAMK